MFAPFPPAARSAYLYQVRAIAPKALADREDELAELANFCTQPGAADYMCWRARAWAGKTALMAWFVLNPPAGTRIISFFVTARLSAQSDREAFLDVVIEQLATLLGEPLPPYLTAATRAAHLWRMLDAGAAACAEQGQRLVLVVDGLDEDSGAEHSIAALLPARPASGMRIVVTMRPHPPIPPDVPSGHPLRDPAAECVLAVSPHAQVVRRDAELELKRLLRGTREDQDLLGLVATAGGGLSSRDLAELMGHQVWEVEEALHAVVGRSFTRRPAPGWSGTGGVGDVYVLGHEELQQTAVRFLGDARLAEYRQQLHAWADQYRKAHWPSETPGYLLHGYFRMLHTESDLPRMIDCALDKTRHDRMLDISGGDTAAFTEITTTQVSILDCSTPDLWAMTLLAVHRDNLAQRNSNVPIGLPAVWALLGRPRRAEALARSIPDPGNRVRSLIAVIRVLAECDVRIRAESGASETNAIIQDLVHEAEAAARTIVSPFERALAVVALAETVGQGGDAGRANVLAREAEAVARTIINAGPQARVLAAVAEGLARVGDTDHADELARTITNSRARNRALASVAAARLRGEAEVPARSVATPDPRTRTSAGEADMLAVEDANRASDPSWDIAAPLARTRMLVAAAETAARAGDTDRAEEFAYEAEASARTITSPGSQVRALVTMAKAMARAGDIDRAERLARTITEPHTQTRAFALIAKAVARAGDLDRAEDLARSIPNPRETSRALTVAAVTSAGGGDPDRGQVLTGEAEAAARIISNPQERTRALVAVAEAAARAGDFHRAQQLAREAEATAMSVVSGRQRASVMGAVARAMARAGDIEHAEDLAQTIRNPHERALVRVAGAEAAALAGDVGRAEELARTIRKPREQTRALVAVALAVAQAGDTDRADGLVREAEAVARTVPDPSNRVQALVAVAVRAARAGDVDHAADLAREAEATAQTVIDARPRESASAVVARVMAQSGYVDRAVKLARSIPHTHQRARALAVVASHVDTARACPLIAQALQIDTWHTSIDALASHRPDVLTVVADELLAGQCEAQLD
ncbi:hypothetical protein ACFV9E_04640 [Streptomyces sp. NPDC059835]|uniref:hypothetical protein n=1 Tax=Streptomyces sp. NPDC059835 TaxID=3346967 RepID=UPI003650F2C5